MRALHRVGVARRRARRPRSAPGPRRSCSSASPTAGGAVRTWTSVGDFTQEVALARIYDGVHYRNSTEVGAAMGQKIGELAAKSVPKATR